MNKVYVLTNLEDAKELLTNLIREIEDDNEDGFGQFFALLPFVYRQLNRAWNGRFATDQELIEGTHFDAGFPQDLELFIRDERD
jgi:hypothetical protein